jgi:hypothetical protein
MGLKMEKYLLPEDYQPLASYRALLDVFRQNLILA